MGNKIFITEIVLLVVFIVGVCWFWITHPLKAKYWNRNTLPYTVQEIDDRLTDLENRVSELEKR